MTKKERIEHIRAWFKQQFPVAETELHYNSPWELIVAVVLSAQCTDKRINQVTPELFKAFPNPQAMKDAGVEEIFEYIKSVSYPNNKAKHLAGLAAMLVENHQSNVPDTMEALIKLPGVGRKTANVILSVLYQQPAMAVDTHVFRVSQRLGLTRGAKTPLETEKQLMKIFPEKEVPQAHHWLILHGRYTCKARNPECDSCGLNSWCGYVKNKKRTEATQA